MHKDYQMEFERYTQDNMPICKITQEEYEDYLLNCLHMEESQVKNQRLKSLHNEVVQFINNIDSFDVSHVNRLSGGKEREI